MCKLIKILFVVHFIFLIVVFNVISEKFVLGLIGVARIFDWGGQNPQKFGCLHRNWEWILGQNRKFERFFRPKSGDLQKKKKKVFTEIKSDFSARNQVISKKKKKKVFTEIESGFSAETVSFTVTLLFNYCYVRNYWKKTATKHRQAMLS